MSSPGPEKKKYRQTTFSLVMTPELRQRLGDYAESQDRSPASVARLAITKFLEEQGF